MSTDRSDTATLAVGYWAVGWVVAQLASLLVITTFRSGDDPTDLPISLLGAAALASWSVLLVMLAAFSRRVGSGDFRRDYHVFATARDALGIPGGVAIQLVVVPILYTPLKAIWPATFSDAKVQDTARDLADRAGGLFTVVLIAMVVVGAPIVEELVYRGLLQRWLATRFTRLTSLLIVAGLFTIIHLRPVEYPGLAVFSLAVGTAAHVTGRIGAPVALHVGFNAAGLVVAF